MDGKIEVCPHCGKNGLADRRDGLMRYLHSVEQEKDGPKFEMCPRSVGEFSN
jgi:hypothetical protein